VESHKDWDGVRDHHEHEAKRQARLHALWNPLLPEHPRVQLWIQHVYQHMKPCYRDVENPQYGPPGTLIYPVPEQNAWNARHRSPRHKFRYISGWLSRPYAAGIYGAL
jgi:hypothetical protein